MQGCFPKQHGIKGMTFEQGSILDDDVETFYRWMKMFMQEAGFKVSRDYSSDAKYQERPGNRSITEQSPSGQASCSMT